MAVENYIFWSEIGSGSEEAGGTPPPRILRSIPPLPGIWGCFAKIRAGWPCRSFGKWNRLFFKAFKKNPSLACILFLPYYSSPLREINTYSIWSMNDKDPTVNCFKNSTCKKWIGLTQSNIIHIVFPPKFGISIVFNFFVVQQTVFTYEWY